MPLSSVSKLTFHSTNKISPKVDLREALLQGQAPDKGLYMPDTFPTLSEQELESFRDASYPEIATEILWKFAEGIISKEKLSELCHDAYDYEVPLEHVYDRVHVMRLDRGPTASFKDFAARMMARLIGTFIKEDNSELLILTATSGDTGSAVASAFHGIEGIEVCVLFPKGEVSDRQRKQMTTLGGNIQSICVEGKFDDCQAMVKRAFADPDLKNFNLSSANSINIGRLLPQSVYYVYAWSRLTQTPGEDLVIVVPSGNFGNMMGSVFARQMGISVKKIVVPVNANDEVPTYLKTDNYQKIVPSLACLSNAMNVGHPSNLARLVELYGGHIDEVGGVVKQPDMNRMRKDIFSSSVSDEETRLAIKDAWSKHQLLLEPHGAVGWKGFQDYIQAEPLDGSPAVIVETAHPAKFPDAVEETIQVTPDVPPSLSRLERLEEQYHSLPGDYDAFKEHLKSVYTK